MAKYDWFKEWPTENENKNKPEPGTNEYYWEGLEVFGYAIFLGLFGFLTGVVGMVWIVYEFVAYLMK